MPRRTVGSGARPASNRRSVVPGTSPVPSSELGPADRDRFGETGNVQTATGRPAASRRREELVAGFVLRVQQKAPGTRTMGHRTLRFRVSVRLAYWARIAR